MVEEGIYTIKPGQIPAFLAIYEREGLAAQRRHLGEPVSWFTSEFGQLNHVVRRILNVSSAPSARCSH